MYWEYVLLIALLIVTILALRKVGARRGEDTRAARLMKKYKVMTREMLDNVPEGELVDAVVCRVLARAEDARRPDPVKVLTDMEHGSTVVYSVWVVCKEMAAGDFATMMHSRSREMAALAADGFDAIGAPGCAGAWRALLEGAEDMPGAEKAFREAVGAEQPLALCEDYIRDHAEEFIDE